VSKADDIDAIILRANGLASGVGSPLIHGEAYYAASRALREPLRGYGLSFYDQSGNHEARLMTLAFALTILGWSNEGSST